MNNFDLFGKVTFHALEIARSSCSDPGLGAYAPTFIPIGEDYLRHLEQARRLKVDPSAPRVAQLYLIANAQAVLEESLRKVALALIEFRHLVRAAFGRGSREYQSITLYRNRGPEPVPIAPALVA